LSGTETEFAGEGGEGQDSGSIGGPAEREIDAPAPRQGRLERAIGRQVRRLRQARGLTLAEAAVRTGVSAPMLSKVENASISCSLSTLDRIAAAFEVPVAALIRGADSSREAVFTPAGSGGRIVARGTRAGHDYTLIGGLRGTHKRMEAHIVTLTERSEEFPLFQHPGTELLYVLEGEMVYAHEDSSYRMRPGDALQLDGEGVHGPRELTSVPIRFLSVVAYGDADLD
jgi:quercetin dioxygenase-like cupin family protein/DNA-binding XRE family transcriptional regulator